MTDVTENRVEAKPRVAGQLNSTFTPYFSQSYEIPQQVLELFPIPEEIFPTPSFTNEKRAFTSQEEMMAFLRELEESTDYMRLEVIGHSQEGREIPMAVFSTSESEEQEDFKSKPTVWLQAHVHGHEPASGESALVVAYKLAKEPIGKELLESINVIIVPRINPDSVYYFEQLSPTQINGNRDHVNLEMPELQALHQAYSRFNAEVVIDAHEYEATPTYPYIGEAGAMRYHDMLILSGKNLNIPESIRKKSDEWFVENAFKALAENGFTYGHYFTVHERVGDKTIVKEGGGDAGIGRNAFALKPSFCFLTESLGIGIGRQNFLRRVTGQVITHMSILQTAKEKSNDIKALIAEARNAICEGGEKGKDNETIIIKSNPKQVPDSSVKAIDLAQAKVIDIPVTYYSMTDAVPTLVRKRPNAYLLPPAYHQIAAKLAMLGAEINRLADEQELEVEIYEVTKKEIRDAGSLSIASVETELKKKTFTFPKNSYVIHCAQPTALLVSLALEPESDYSYVTHQFIPATQGRDLPIYRYVEDTGNLLLTES